MLQDSLQILKDSTQLANEVLDFIPPEKVDMSSTGPGWYILGGIVAVLLFIIAVRAYINFLKNTYKRVAIRDIETVVTNQLSLQESVYQINTTLKRVAITSFDREQVAHLNGQAWIEFLNAHWKSNFTDKESELLMNAAYMKPSENNSEVLSHLILSSKKWIKNHV